MKVKRFFKFGLVVVAVGLCVLVWFFVRVMGRADYEVVDLSMAGGVIFSVRAINDAGQVAGHFVRECGGEGACIWDEVNGVVELPDIDGKSFYIRDLNNKGQVVGLIEDPNSLSVGFFRDSDGEITRFSTKESITSVASSINDKGEVAGVIRRKQSDPSRSEKSHLFVWDKIGGMRIVDEIAGDILLIQGINEAGQVGGVVRSGNLHRGFYWSERSGVVFLDQRVTSVFDIDGDGKVLGAISTPDERLFFWSESAGLRILSVDVGEDIEMCRMNSRGDIVGVGIDWGVDLFGDFRLRDDYLPFLYTRDGKMVSLDHLFGEYFGPIDINNKGWIVGNALDEHSYFGSRGVLLRPE